MDSELLDRVKHLARDGVSAEFKIFGKAIVALLEENSKLREDLKEIREEAKEAKQELKEMIKASAGGGTGAPVSAGLRRPVFKRPGATDEEGESEEGEEMEGEEGAEEEKPGGPSVPPPPSLGAFGD